MIATRYRCPKCNTPVHVREDGHGVGPRCPRCSAQLKVPRAGAPHRPALEALSAPRVLAVKKMPWSPGLIFAASFLFGPLAGGVLTAINFARMDRPHRRVRCAVIGALLFALLLPAALLPGGTARLVASLVSLACALGLALAQRSTYYGWVAGNLAPDSEGTHYEPSGLGELLLIGLVCLAIQAGAFLLVALSFPGP